jgi:hypothetical protein
MKNRELSRQLQRLNNLIARTDEASNSNLELQAHWAKYLCVLCAGFLENLITEIYVEYARVCANEAVAGYVARQLERIQNPNSQNLLNTTYQFKKSWGKELETYLTQDGRKEAIDTIMTNRHKIAHGEDSNITIIRLKEYLAKIIEVAEFMENQCS